ncbi:MAG TPA: cysteine desulfurase family protein [Ilumatobacteraceae bacterium]|nr:cysteine desulfurase family protein [Ilumatobacteraceae bacterium]HRB05171.1 cysteine desulfurase family protein [Ilumatobacteraceae bacterium]
MPGYTYLDHAATTPMRPEAVAAMLPYLFEHFANPSGSHRFAREARTAIDDAREVMATAIGCKPGEVIFNGGGTEADNTSIRGVLARRGGTAVCPAAEHHAVLECVHLTHGVVVPTTATGAVDLDALAVVLSETSDVSVVSVMAVNNEVGTINDMAAVSKIVRRHAPKAVLHTDAVQAACWLDLRTIWPHVDLLSLSAHKFGGPKGVGVLIAREGITFEPALIGGGQERERRSGTHNVGGIVAMAEALRITDEQRGSELSRIAALRDQLVDRLVAELPGVHETVARTAKVAGSAHLCIEGIENEALLFLLDEAGVCASAASACAAGAMEPSHVLHAMGVSRDLAQGALRLTLGATSTAADVDHGVDVIVRAVHQLRRTELAVS